MLGEIRGEVRFKEMLSFHTSLRIGGPADIFVIPQDVDDIRHALLFAEREQLPVAVLGGGNNLLITDRGIRGVVLRLEGCLGRAEFHGRTFIFVDLPGTYSLAPRSPDEMVAVDVLLGRRDDVPPIDMVLCIVDASNLEIGQELSHRAVAALVGRLAVAGVDEHEL